MAKGVHDRPQTGLPFSEPHPRGVPCHVRSEANTGPLGEGPKPSVDGCGDPARRRAGPGRARSGGRMLCTTRGAPTRARAALSSVMGGPVYGFIGTSRG